MPATVNVPLRVPNNLTVSLGFQTGELDAQAAPVFGAAIYNWQVAAANAPTVIVQSSQTTAASNVFTGLTPDVIYAVTVNAVGSAGPSDWTDPVSQMVGLKSETGIQESEFRIKNRRNEQSFRRFLLPNDRDIALRCPRCRAQRRAAESDGRDVNLATFVPPFRARHRSAMSLPHFSGCNLRRPPAVCLGTK